MSGLADMVACFFEEMMKVCTPPLGFEVHLESPETVIAVVAAVQDPFARMLFAISSMTSRKPSNLAVFSVDQQFGSFQGKGSLLTNI